MGQPQVVRRLAERPLLAPPVFAIPARGDPTPAGGPMLAEVEVEALDAGGVELVALEH
jgi:hypothetical protein